MEYCPKCKSIRTKLIDSGTTIYSMTCERSWKEYKCENCGHIFYTYDLGH